MKLTPAMKQYMDVKEQYPDGILLFRMGDFYECFFEDANAVSQILGITLTSRGKGDSKAPLAGIPYHALEKYLKGLVESGNKVVIVEQLEDPKQAKGVVKRGVTRVVTPGTVIEDSILQDKANNYIASIFVDNGAAGLALCDISTGELEVSEYEKFSDLLAELGRVSPSEIVVSNEHEAINGFAHQHHIFLARVNEYYFWLIKASALLKDHFKAESIQQLGLQNMELAVCACGGLLMYLKESQKLSIESLKTIKKHNAKNYLELDEQTIRNLELLKSIADQRREGSLLSVIDHTQTAMGGRLLKQWMIRPLVKKEQIIGRHNAVAQLASSQELKESVSEYLGMIADLERLISRLNYGHANARDLVNIKESLAVLPKLHAEISGYQAITKQITFTQMDELISTIDSALKDECPLTIREGNFIKRGFNDELDELWKIKNNSREILSQIEKEQAEETGISTLKIKYNKVFGYFIEVTKRYKDQVPSHYQSKQSTVNAERYITDELKELEVKILSAQDKIQSIEFELFTQLCAKVKAWTTQILANAKAVATLDCLLSFAVVSLKRRYVQPEVTQSYACDLTESRHAVVEVIESRFVANDCSFDENKRMMVITGPNMAGKSTFMRQIALTYLLCQMGCFVPAKTAKLGIVDKVFTRVGSRDNLSKGQSTFMVEMEEVAFILHNATEKSFIILDEIGSGTSTYDGVAIAWSVAQEIATRIKAKTLFSTHYHVLTRLEELPSVKNYHVAVHEDNGKITFLRKIVPGGTDKSYGLHVAELAGVPRLVIEHAQAIQIQLTNEDSLSERLIVEKRPQHKSAEVAFAKLKQKTLFDEKTEENT